MSDTDTDATAAAPPAEDTSDKKGVRSFSPRASRPHVERVACSRWRTCAAEGLRGFSLFLCLGRAPPLRTGGGATHCRRGRNAGCAVQLWPAHQAPVGLLFRLCVAWRRRDVPTCCARSRRCLAMISVPWAAESAAPPRGSAGVGALFRRRLGCRQLRAPSGVALCTTSSFCGALKCRDGVAHGLL